MRKLFGLVLVAMLAPGCDALKEKFGDGPTEPTEPSAWSTEAPRPVEAGTTGWILGIRTEIGVHQIFEFDWGSAANSIHIAVYSDTPGGREDTCNVPPTIPDGVTEHLPTCAVVAADTTDAKPKRLEWDMAPGDGVVMVAINNGPGDEAIIFREGI